MLGQEVNMTIKRVSNKAVLTVTLRMTPVWLMTPTSRNVSLTRTRMSVVTQSLDVWSIFEPGV